MKENYELNEQNYNEYMRGNKLSDIEKRRKFKDEKYRVPPDKWICDTEGIEIPFTEVTNHIAKGCKVHNTLGKKIATKYYSLTPKGLEAAKAIKAVEEGEMTDSELEDFLEKLEEKYEG